MEMYCIFELNNPSNSIYTEFEVSQSIFDGWYPTSEISHGHKHLCILNFKESIPELVLNLFELKKGADSIPSDLFGIGLCDFRDIDAITEKIELKKK